MKTIILNNINLFIIPNSLTEDELGQLQVQLWGYTDGNDKMSSSANIEDHSVELYGIGFASPKLGFIPISNFAGKAEGDSVTFTTNGWVEDPETHKREEATFILQDAVLNQRNNRYSRFGNFEKVLKSLIASAKAHSIGA